MEHITEEQIKQSLLLFAQEVGLEGVLKVLQAIEKGHIKGNIPQLGFADEGIRYGCFLAQVTGQEGSLSRYNIRYNIRKIIGETLYLLPFEIYIMDVRPGETHLTNQYLSTSHQILSKWYDEKSK